MVSTLFDQSVLNELKDRRWARANEMRDQLLPHAGSKACGGSVYGVK